jgi:DNA-binding MarR family transcriptional regulator
MTGVQMTDTETRRELLARMRDVLKAMRLFKNQQPPRQMAVPTGTLGLLASIDDLTPVTGCHVKDLALANALDPSTVSRAVAALVRAGLVGRTADPIDGRASVLALTQQGRQALTDVTGWYDDVLAEALSDWTEPEVAAFSAMLQRFCNDLITRTTTPLEPAR